MTQSQEFADYQALQGVAEEAQAKIAQNMERVIDQTNAMGSTLVSLSQAVLSTREDVTQQKEAVQEATEEARRLLEHAETVVEAVSTVHDNQDQLNQLANNFLTQVEELRDQNSLSHEQLIDAVKATYQQHFDEMTNTITALQNLQEGFSSLDARPQIEALNAQIEDVRKDLVKTQTTFNEGHVVVLEKLGHMTDAVIELSQEVAVQVDATNELSKQYTRASGRLTAIETRLAVLYPEDAPTLESESETVETVEEV